MKQGVAQKGRLTTPPAIWHPTIWHRFGLTLFLSNGLSVALYLVRVIGTGTVRYNFMVWNLLLAVLPLLFSIMLVRRLRAEGWIRWQNWILTFLWLGFLPNSFYLMTDLVHLQPSGEINILFDTVMMLSFIFNGLIMGFLSIYLVHRQLLKRLTRRWAQPVSWAHAVITVVFIAVSFAIYLGRSLRWNSWDILLNPAGLLYDVSDLLVHPITYPEAILTTVTFSLFIGVMYLFVYQIASLIFAKTPSVSNQRKH